MELHALLLVQHEPHVTERSRAGVKSKLVDQSEEKPTAPFFVFF